MSPDLIQQWIHDSLFVKNEMVSVKHVSSRFALDVRESIKKLEQFAVDNTEVYGAALYYISGYKSQDGTKMLTISFANGCDLEVEKKTFDEIVSCYIYALNPVVLKNPIDGYMLSNEENSKISEFSPFEFTSAPAKSVQKPPAIAKIGDSVQNMKPKNVDRSPEKSKILEKSKPEVVSPEKFSLRSKQVPGKSVTKPKANKTNPMDKFTKAITKPQISPKKVEEEKSPGKVLTKNATQDFMLSNTDLFAADSSPENSPQKNPSNISASPRRSPRLAPKNSAPKSAINSSKSAKRKLNDSKKSKKQKKNLEAKEKRDSSESDEEAENSIIQPTPETHSRKKQPVEEPDLVRTQKMVHKTYLDDEGYLVTVQESEMDEQKNDIKQKSKINAESSNSTVKTEDVSPKKGKSTTALPEPKKTKPAKKNDTSNKKQASLMSFFKK